MAKPHGTRGERAALASHNFSRDFFFPISPNKKFYLSPLTVNNKKYVQNYNFIIKISLNQY